MLFLLLLQLLRLSMRCGSRPSLVLESGLTARLTSRQCAAPPEQFFVFSSSPYGFVEQTHLMSVVHALDVRYSL